MKNDMKIVLRGIQSRHNGESAVPGTASTVINLREREEALEVVGVPRQVGTLSPGDRVLLVDDNTLDKKASSCCVALPLATTTSTWKTPSLNCILPP